MSSNVNQSNETQEERYPICNMVCPCNKTFYFLNCIDKNLAPLYKIEGMTLKEKKYRF